MIKRIQQQQNKNKTTTTKGEEEEATKLHHSSTEKVTQAPYLLAAGILDVDNIEVTRVLLAVDNVAHTARVASSSDQHLHTVVELDEVDDLAYITSQ